MVGCHCPDDTGRRGINIALTREKEALQNVEFNLRGEPVSAFLMGESGYAQWTH